MIYESEADFAARLKNFEPHRVYFLYGEQNYLKKLYVNKLIAKLVEPTFADFNLNRFDGTADLDEISDAVEALPVMAPRKCVLVTDLDCSKLPAAQAKKLEELLRDPPESTVLIFTTIDVAVDVKKNAKWRAFLKKVDLVGAAVELKTRPAAENNRFLRTLAERAGCSISPDGCRYLVQRCGDDMQVLKNEMDKLCAYRRGGEITREDIDACAIPLLDASVFDLARLILQRDYQRAMKSLMDLVDLREEPVLILGALSGSFIDLYRAKVARENAKSAPELAKLFSQYRGKEWRIKNALRDCEKLHKSQIREVLGLLANADYRLKSSRTEQTIILQETVARIASALSS